MSPEERSPLEARLRRNAETDRVREGMSEGCRSADPDGSLREMRERLSTSPSQTSRGLRASQRERELFLIDAALLDEFEKYF